MVLMVPPSRFPGDGGGGLRQARRRASLKLPPDVPRGLRSAAKAEVLDQLPVALEILPLEVVEEATAPTDQLEQPAARMVILAVGPKVLREAVDAPCQERDLHLGRTRVGAGTAVLAEDLLLCFLREGQRS